MRGVSQISPPIRIVLVLAVAVMGALHALPAAQGGGHPARRRRPVRPARAPSSEPGKVKEAAEGAVEAANGQLAQQRERRRRSTPARPPPPARRRDRRQGRAARRRPRCRQDAQGPAEAGPPGDPQGQGAGPPLLERQVGRRQGRPRRAAQGRPLGRPRRRARRARSSRSPSTADRPRRRRRAVADDRRRRPRPEGRDARRLRRHDHDRPGGRRRAAQLGRTVHRAAT